LQPPKRRSTPTGLDRDARLPDLARTPHNHALLVVEMGATCGAENLCHQSIFMKHASSAVASPDAELTQACDAIWQRAERCSLL